MIVTILFGLEAFIGLVVVGVCTLAAYQISRRLDEVIRLLRQHDVDKH